MQETQETQIWPSCQEDLLEEEMATRSRILAGEFPGHRNLDGYSPWGRKGRTQLSTRARRGEKPVDNYSKQQLSTLKAVASVRWAEGWLWVDSSAFLGDFFSSGPHTYYFDLFISLFYIGT